MPRGQTPRYLRDLGALLSLLAAMGSGSFYVAKGASGSGGTFTTTVTTPAP